MALISCPECGHQISDTAPACPQCGYVMKTPERDTIQKDPFAVVTNDAVEPQTDSSPVPKMLGGCLISIVCTFIFIIILAAVFALGSSDSTSDTSRTYDLYAYTFAKLYITENYVSDADFDYSSTTISSSGSDYTVSGKFTHSGLVNTYTIKMTMHGKSSADIYSFTLNGVPVV